VTNKAKLLDELARCRGKTLPSVPANWKAILDPSRHIAVEIVHLDEKCGWIRRSVSSL
jgi:hypothetical protein